MLICRPHNMRAFRGVTAQDSSLIGRAALIYDAEAIFSLRDASRAAMEGSAMPKGELRRLVAEEVALARTADLVLAVSERDKAVFQQHGIAPVTVLGHAVVPEPGAARFAERAGFAFVGSLLAEDAPNTDSIHWFVREVLPILRQKLGEELRLRVFGTCEAPSIWKLDGVSLDVMGPVDDLRPALGRTRVVVAPTRFAAGIPHKVHQAAALGVPIVATDLIAGLAGWRNGVELLSASTPEGFAAACLRLHEDEATWTSLRDAALARCIEDCSPAALNRVLERVVVLADTHRTRPHASRR
jgi:glycosyltransferase involved in cell wall biosynthesis